MSRLTLRNSVAALAVLATMGGITLGGAALAQNVAAPAEAQQAMPEALRALNLSDLETRNGRRGTKISGKTAEGVAIEAMISRDGTLRGAHSTDGAALPQSLVDALLPQVLRNNTMLTDIAAITGIGSRDGMTMVMGKDASGQGVRAGFAEDGTLMRFGRGDEMRGRGGKYGGHGMMGRGGDRDRGKGRDRMGEHGGYGHGNGHGGKRGEMQGMAGMPAATPEAVMQALSDAGYTQIGTLTGNGRGIMAEAVNKAGDAVTVYLSPRGQVMREIAR